MAKILLVEDDQDVAINVRDYLTGENHVVENVYNGADAVFRLETYHYDLIVLDLILPDAHGRDICKQYRAQGGKARVIMLTGESEIQDKEQGLDSGADDYLTKPFHPKELAARVRSLMRRVGNEKELGSALLKIGALELDSSARTVFIDGKRVELLPKEFDLLEFFMRSPNAVFSQEALLARVWADEPDISAGTVRVHVRKVREKLEKVGMKSPIKTIHRQGYKFEP